MIKLGNLLSMTNEELCSWFRNEIIETKPGPEWKRRLEEYRNNIERDFQEEWSKKHFKWFFTKRRQNKIRNKIIHRYGSSVFWLIDEAIEDILPKIVDESFQKFVDIKDVALGDKAYFTEENYNDQI